VGEFAIGQGIARFEDPRLLRGGGRYLDDIVLPRMAFGYVLRSPHAHAKIKSIDVTQAKAAPGVVLVLTGADWKRSGWGDLPVPGGQQRRDGSPMYRSPYPALAQERVRWVGDYVAFVVAETYAQAADAAELIAVDYEALPSVTSTADATSAGAARVWEDCPDNICFVHLAGDKVAADAAFARADHIVRHRLVINRVTAVTMEPRGCIGDYDTTSGHFTLYAQPQGVHVFRSDLAKGVLKVPESKVHVIAGDIGGSFGMKSAIFNEAPLVLLASKLAGRPVKWLSTRSEAFLSDAEARDNVTDAELALDKDGTFLGMRVKTVANMGAHLQSGTPNFLNNLGTLAGVYRTPAIHADVTAVYTHTNPVRPYRGNGRPEAAYVIERLVDLAADQTGIDPAELRRRNMIPSEAMPYKTGLTFTYDCGEFEKSSTRECGAPTSPASQSAARLRTSAASCAVSASPTRSNAPARWASRVLKCALIARARSRCLPAASPRARATRPYSSSSCATRSAFIRIRRSTCRATPTRSSSAREPAGHARRRWPARPSMARWRRSAPRRRRLRRICSRSVKAMSISRMGFSPAPRPTGR
jgi:carbon-monoxide dehydrogenase large subunit